MKVDNSFRIILPFKMAEIIEFKDLKKICFYEL